MNPGYILQKCKNWYNRNKGAKIIKSACYSKKCYSDNPDKIDKLKMALNKENKRRLNKEYYERNYGQILYRLRSNYSLPAPNSEAKEYYFTKIIEALYYSPEIVDDL